MLSEKCRKLAHHEMNIIFKTVFSLDFILVRSGFHCRVSASGYLVGGLC